MFDGIVVGDDHFVIPFCAAGCSLYWVEDVVVSHLGLHAFNSDGFDVVQEDDLVTLRQACELACGH